MVGVAGKSKGCNTCRRRKKGCDQRRPGCGQCASSGYRCEGYIRIPPIIPSQYTKEAADKYFLDIKPAPSSPDSLSTADLASPVVRTAIVQQCQSLFFEVFMPYGRCSCRDSYMTRCGHPMNWTEVIPRLRNDEISLELAFSALSISRVGRSQGDLRLVKESNKFYGKALKSLQAALVHPERVHTDQTLAACLLLGYYETFENVEGKSIGWASHVQGAAQVMELRGPEAHSSGSAHYIFLGSRTLILYSALLRRKRTFLAEKPWLTIPWSLRTRRTNVDYLMDVAVKIPGLLEQLDRLEVLTPYSNKRASLLTLLDSCLDVQKALATWAARRRQNAAPMVTAHHHVNDDDDYPFGHDITFQNHLYFNANLIFWSSNLILWVTISEINTLLSESQYAMVTDTSQSILFAARQAREAALNIAQSIPYGLWPEMGDLGISHITFPMGLVYKFFSKSNDTRICQWLAKLSQRAKHMGLNVSRMYDNGSAFNDTDIFERNEQPYGLTAGSRVRSPVATYFDLTKSSVFSTPYRDQYGSSSSCSVDSTTHPQSDASLIRDTSTDGALSPEYDIAIRHEASPPPLHEGLKHKRHGSLGGVQASFPTSFGHLQRASTSMGEFTFVEEDPSTHYIVCESDRSSALGYGIQAHRAPYSTGRR